jgi:ABC-type antimicrobial peptide transport system permease subunit
MVWPVLARSVLSLAALALIAAYVPARRSARMAIVDALGHI